VIQSEPPASTIRSGAVFSPGSVASSVALFVARSMRISVRSRWSITHPDDASKAMSAGPSPTGTVATTLPVAGATRSTAAPWSSATQIEPPPAQRL
jgi:hypothetical protein